MKGIGTRLRNRKTRLSSSSSSSYHLPKPVKVTGWKTTGLADDEESQKTLNNWWTGRVLTEGKTDHPEHPADLQKPTDQVLKRYNSLRKHESSLLTQIRTGRIGLNAFLWERKVPTVLSPHYQCGEGKETMIHLALRCKKTTPPQINRRITTERDFNEALSDQNHSRKIVRWALGLGRLREFDLAIELEDQAEKGCKNIKR